MFVLYAEDTRDKKVARVKALRSCRFSRAMREAEKEPPMYCCRYFIAEAGTDGPKMETAAYLGVKQKPAPVGSPENQAHQRATLRRQKPSARSGKVDWGEQNAQGETLAEKITMSIAQADREARKQVGLS